MKKINFILSTLLVFISVNVTASTHCPYCHERYYKNASVENGGLQSQYNNWESIDLNNTEYFNMDCEYRVSCKYSNASNTVGLFYPNMVNKGKIFFSFFGIDYWLDSKEKSVIHPNDGIPMKPVKIEKRYPKLDKVDQETYLDA